MQALARHYPQQMYFPFKLSKQHYGPEGQARADSLQPLLSSPLMEQWGAALNDTTYPAQRWEGWVGRLSGLVAAGDKVHSQFAVSQPCPIYPCHAQLLQLPTNQPLLKHARQISRHQHHVTMSFDPVLSNTTQLSFATVNKRVCMTIHAWIDQL